MPYIKQNRRSDYVDSLTSLVGILQENSFPPGDLNFIITYMLRTAWESNPRYDTGNELIGVLECAKQEFYRRQLVPYEEIKREENGDV